MTIGLGVLHVALEKSLKVYTQNISYALMKCFLRLKNFLYDQGNIFETLKEILLGFFCATNNKERLKTDPPEPQILIAYNN